MDGKATRPAKSRHTIELVLAVVLLTWALVFLGYQMGSTGANRFDARFDFVETTAVSGIPANASTKGDSGKVGAPSSSVICVGWRHFSDTNAVPPINRRTSFDGGIEFCVSGDSGADSRCGHVEAFGPDATRGGQHCSGNDGFGGDGSRDELRRRLAGRRDEDGR